MRTSIAARHPPIVPASRAGLARLECPKKTQQRLAVAGAQTLEAAPGHIRLTGVPANRIFGRRRRAVVEQRTAEAQSPERRSANLVVEVDVLNLFNAINFNPVALPANPTNRDAYRVTTSYQDINQASDPGSRVGQLVFRLNW